MLSIYLTSQPGNQTNGETIHHQKLFNVLNLRTLLARRSRDACERENRIFASMHVSTKPNSGRNTRHYSETFAFRRTYPTERICDVVISDPDSTITP